MVNANLSEIGDSDGVIGGTARVAKERETLLPLINNAVANVFGVRPNQLVLPHRGDAHLSLCRQVAMYLTHVHLGLTLTRTGALYRRDRTTVAHACELVENKRDDPLFDAALDVLERAFLAVEVFAVNSKTGDRR